jgi:hypothetical protein
MAEESNSKEESNNENLSEAIGKIVATLEQVKTSDQYKIEKAASIIEESTDMTVDEYTEGSGRGYDDREVISDE